MASGLGTPVASGYSATGPSTFYPGLTALMCFVYGTKNTTASISRVAPDAGPLKGGTTVTITGTLIDHGRVAGKPLHRQDTRKHGAPAHTVTLPRFGVDALTALIADTGGLAGPVADALEAPSRADFEFRHRALRYFFLPSLRKMYSPVYLTPLPL